MQKVINGMAVASFVISLGIIGTAGYVYTQKDSIVSGIREAAIAEVSKAIPGLISGLMPSIPEVPSMTGGAIPSGGSIPSTPSTTGPALPF